MVSGAKSYKQHMHNGKQKNKGENDSNSVMNIWYLCHFSQSSHESDWCAAQGSGSNMQTAKREKSWFLFFVFLFFVYTK